MDIRRDVQARCINPDCREPVGYWEVNCRWCNQPLGFPNRRAAESERDELAKRYALARNDATQRNIEPLLNKLEILAEQSRPVINMPFAVGGNILRSDKYRNYYQRIDSGERAPATARNHADRVKVGESLFPMYEEHIQYAALSPDGRGLVSYGPVAVRWEVVPSYLDRRISLLQEDSFIFYDQFKLGDRGATVPPGYRAIWDDRAKLVAAKFASRLTAATAEGSLAGLLMHAGATKKDDDYVEIFIYDDVGLETRDVDLVTIQRAPMTPEEGHWRDLVRDACAARPRAIRVVE